MNCFFYVILGILPSIIWLLFYLGKDAHPESKQQVLKIFCYGALATLPAFFMEKTLSDGIKDLILPHLLFAIMNFTISIAMVEEFLKYLVVREKAVTHSEFDEPVDVMIYMIVAALGIAAVENILYIVSSLDFGASNNQVIELSASRFIGATFLHTLCSGIIGYFWAMSLFRRTEKTRYLLLGFFIAVMLHGIYNFSKMEISGETEMAVVELSILIGSAIFVFWGFERLKKMPSVCHHKIKN